MSQQIVQEHWQNKELLGYDSIVLGSGEVIIMSGYSVIDGTKKSYFINAVCDTTVESIEKYNDDPWVEITIHPQHIKLENGDTIYCGEGSMGNEGFVALEDKDGNLKWAFFSTQSNPFVGIDLMNDTIRAHSTYERYYNINLLSPENIKISDIR